MTTIAYRDGVIAADTMGIWGGDVSYGHGKVARTRKYIMGFAGAFAFARPLYDWLLEIENEHSPQEFYKRSELLPDMTSDMSALIANESGELWALVNDGFCAPLIGEYEVLGSGGRFALGAMFMGGTAEEGIRAAIRHDDASGGDVKMVSFDQDPFPPF